MSYDKWKKINLSEIVASVSTSFKFNRDKLVLVNTSDVLDGKVLNHTFEKNEKIKGQFKKAFEKDDILYSEIRPKNKRFAYIDFKPEGYVASTKLMVLRGESNKVDNKFLYQILTSTEMINKLQQIAESRSGTFPQITFTQLGEQEVYLPPLAEQKAIANILSSLDDKIELNNKINKNLEEMTQTLYKQWFVDFEFPNENGEPYKSSGGEMIESELGLIPKGWVIKKLLDISNVYMGAPYKSSLFDDKEGVPVIRIRDLKTMVPKKHTIEKHKREIKVIPSDVLVGMDAEFTPTLWTGKTGYLNQRVFKIEPKEQNVSKYYIYELIKPSMSFFENTKSGTTVIHLGKRDLDTVNIKYPTKNILHQFKKKIDPIYERVILNSLENNKLKEVRDTLLPKLMSGEIEVPIEG